MKMHKSINVHRVMRAVESRMHTLANPGFCVECGKSSNECEPDARNYKCEHCGKKAVFGAEELLMHLA